MLVSRTLLAALALTSLAAAPAEAQMMYYQTPRPVVAAPVFAPAYVANYTPAGNYAAVTAYSPPVYAQPAAIAVTSNYAPAVAPVAVTSYYAPTVVNYAPTVAHYAPIVVNYAPLPTVAYSPVMAAPMPVMAPVTAFYAPTAVVAPLYRRGPFGGLRPVRQAYYIPY